MDSVCWLFVILGIIVVTMLWGMLRNNITCDYLISRINNDDRHNGSYESVLFHPVRFPIIKMLKYIRKNGVNDQS